ncbi:hypothetical protein NMG60_11014882 [Bertholletia excelsa]
MERTSAACALEWSIDLEKGLRSKKPGKCLDAILQTGPRLEQWDREPTINRAQYNMFGLILGEDKLFANAIFLRLANAFRSGDRDIKLCVVKIFLSMLRNHKKGSKQRDGILFKCTSENQLELIRRVKTSFDAGDVESRALVLVLFGCWAEIAKDSAEIRYLILSSLCSHDILQVEASLFAGLCFCKLSDDFASILLEILVNMVKSSEILPTVRLAGVRAFAKICHSSTLASKAYEAGLKLLSDFAGEDLLVAMLISLSKIASKSANLIPRQLGLLSSFLSEEPLHLRATALKCLHYIVVRGICFAASAISVKGLISMLDEPDLPPALHCGILQIVRKVLLYNLVTMPSIDMIGFSELFTILENVSKSPIMATRHLALRVLVEISIQLMGRKEKALEGFDSTALLSTVIIFVIDQISLMVRTSLDIRPLDSGKERNGEELLNLLLLVVEKYPNLSQMVLDNVCLLTENIVNMQDQVIDSGELDLQDHEIMECRRQNRIYVASKLLLYASKVVVACLEKLNQAGTLTKRVLDKMGPVVEHVTCCSLFDRFSCTVHHLLLHSHVAYCFMLNEVEKNDNFDRNSSLCLKDYSARHKLLALDCVKNMLSRKDNWSAYKIGKYAAHKGAWSVATFVFDHLVTRVQSNSCRGWLQSLAEFADSERRIQLLILPEKGFNLVHGLKINEAVPKPVKVVLGERDQGINWKLDLLSNVDNLVGACNSIRSSRDTMRAITISVHALYFQTWFLTLRAKVLESVVDILNLYCKPLTEDNMDNHGLDVAQGSRFLQWVTSVTCSLNQISSQLLRLAQEFNLLATSFMGIDRKSLNILLSHALSCSLLAFSTAFSLFFARTDIENSLEVSEGCLHCMLMHDLLWRLQHIDCETSAKLRLLWGVCRRPKNPFPLQSRNQMLNISCETKGLLMACNYAVEGVVALQNEAKGAKDDKIPYLITKDGLQLLLDIITRWIFVPFQTPSYFFRVRPCISAELFAVNNDNINPDEISVLSGFHLSLSLCLQLKNVPLDFPVHLSKFYCILYCRTSFQESYLSERKGQMQLNGQDGGFDDMLYLNDKLLQHVARSTKKAGNTGCRLKSGDSGTVDLYVYFELNEKGRGFSTCLLDVSSFPVGSYRIKWHSCCVDNEDSYWSLVPLNAGPVFTVKQPLND